MTETTDQQAIPTDTPAAVQAPENDNEDSAATSSSPPDNNNTNDDNDNTTTNNNNNSSSSSSSRWKRLILSRAVLVLPYLLGLMWTSVHPIFSILTGEPKCRGWYIDENSILTRHPLVGSGRPPNHLSALPAVPLKEQEKKSTTTTTLCDALRSTNTTSSKKNIGCYTHLNNEFQVASIISSASALEPTDETIVFVVNSPPPLPQSSSLSDTSSDGTTRSGNDWTATTFHVALLKSLQVLADPVETPWMAKTFLLVSPIGNTVDDEGSTTNNNNSLEDTVSNFLNAYHGTSSSSSSGHYQSSPPLPPHLCQGILRNLIVIDVQQLQPQPQRRNDGSSTTTPLTQFSILPHGRRGVLPNADLVFLVGKLFSRATFVASRDKQKFNPPVQFLAHAYPEMSQAWRDWTATQYSSLLQLQQTQKQQQQTQQQKKKQKWIKTWLDELGDMALFAYTAAVGPFPPHAPALDRGVDAITIRVKFEASSNNYSYKRDPSVEIVQYMEYLLRSLSGLHERLHHSFTLYWLPSPSKFVSHIEYMLPIVLLLLPCMIRALGLVLLEMKKQDNVLHLETVGMSILLTITSMVSTGIVSMMMMMMITGTATTTTASSSSDVVGVMNVWWVILYSLIGYIFYTWRRHVDTTNTTDNNNNSAVEEQQHKQHKQQRILQTLQFVACTTAIYVLIPIVFAHGALAYAPLLLWTPLLAFPKYWTCGNSSKYNMIYGCIGIVVLVATAPPVLVVPRIFSQYTAFVKFAYMPLHLQLFLLVLGMWIRPESKAK